MDESDTEDPMTVELRFYAPLRENVGQKSVALELPRGVTLADAIDRVARDHPDLDGEVLSESGDLRDGVRALRNGRARAEADTRLEDGDEVSFTTPIHGG